MSKVKLEDFEVNPDFRLEDGQEDFAKELLSTDLWETYEALTSMKWDNLTDNQKKQIGSKETFLENTNFAITSLNLFYQAAYEFAKEKKLYPKKLLVMIGRKLKNMKLLTIEEI